MKLNWLKPKKCKKCGKEFMPTNNRHWYCGSILKKTGCSYLMSLAYHAPYRQKNKKKLQKKSYQYYREHKIEATIRARQHHLKKYNLSMEDYKNLTLKQNGVCAICGDTNNLEKNLYIDHCHISGNIRGLLCQRCNTAIGLLKDNVLILQKAINYLEGK